MKMMGLWAGYTFRDEDLLREELRNDDWCIIMNYVGAVSESKKTC